MDFYNQFEHTIDAKGRLVLPALYRPALRRRRDAHLHQRVRRPVHPRRLGHAASPAREHREVHPRDLQYLWGMAAPFVPDAQNRIVLSPILREKAHLDGEVTIVGSVTHAAIYPRAAWALTGVGDREHGRTTSPSAAKFEELGFL